MDARIDIATKLILAGILAAITLACCLTQDWSLVVLLIALGGSLILAGGKCTWAMLAFWSYFWLSWSGYEIFVWLDGNDKFGQMSIPYGIGGLVFAAASLLSARATYARKEPQESWFAREWRNFKKEIGWR